MVRSRWLVGGATLVVAVAGARLAGGEDTTKAIPAELRFEWEQSWQTTPEPGMEPSSGTTRYEITMPGFFQVLQQKGNFDFRLEQTKSAKPKGSAYAFTLPDEIAYCTAKPNGRSHFYAKDHQPIITTVTEGSGPGGRSSLCLATTGAGDDLYPYSIGAQLVLDDPKRTITDEDGTKTESATGWEFPGGGAVESPCIMEGRNPPPPMGATPAPFMKGFSFAAIEKAVTSGSTTSVSGSESWSYEDEHKTKFHGSSKVTLTIRPSGYEAILKVNSKESYDVWTPEGPTPPKTAGKGGALGFKVVLRDKKTHAEVKDVAFKTKFTLRDTSSMPGYCTNYPQEKKAGVGSHSDDDFEFDKPDLRFAKDDNPADATISGDGLELTTAEDKGHEAVSVGSYDYGAYGKLQATVTVKGADITAEADPDLPGAKGSFSISIPKDDNANHVADQWEKERELRDLPSSWDKDDKQGKQRREGDGYTLYEEYRGFVVIEDGKPKHIRTNPLAKDCFVYDEDGLFKKYYEKNNPSKLDWHYVDKTMFRFVDEKNSERALDPNHRWVNTNSKEGDSETFYARQYLVHLVNRWIDDSGEGDAQDLNAFRSLLDKKAIPGLDPAQKAALKNVFRVCISVKKITDFANYNYKKEDAAAVRESQIEETVCHEVGHAIGIRHHRPVDERHPDGSGAENDSIYDGVSNCSMRYENARELPDARYMKNPHVYYCRAGETFKDKDGNEVPADDCFDQIDVKSDR